MPRIHNGEKRVSSIKDVGRVSASPLPPPPRDYGAPTVPPPPTPDTERPVMDRNELVQEAKLAEQAERGGGAAACMTSITEQGAKLSNEESSLSCL